MNPNFEIVEKNDLFTVFWKPLKKHSPYGFETYDEAWKFGMGVTWGFELMEFKQEKVI